MTERNNELNIILDSNGRKQVKIDEIIFPSKRRIDWAGVETYLKRYIGKKYVIAESGEKVFIGTDLPDEYAKLGWYRYTVRFSIPTYDEVGNQIGRNNYQGRMIVRHDADGKNIYMTLSI